MNSGNPAKKRVRFETILFEFIEPLIVLFKNGQNYYIASALPSDSGFVQEYLVVSVTPKYFKRYFREECDLRYLFASAKGRRLFRMDANQLGLERAEIVEFEDEVTEAMLPEPQFFASSHSHVYKELSSRHDAREALLIDGSWEMEDFGKFSSRYRDIYSFEDSLCRLGSEDTSASQKAAIYATFKRHALQGGGSYVNLFRELVSVIPANDQYELNRVQYASPGRIELNGKGDVFDIVEKRIRNMVAKPKPLHDAYWGLYNFMSSSGLLDISNPVSVVSGDTSLAIEEKTSALLNEMDFGAYASLKELTGGSVVNTAKLTLAMYRRLKSASSYFAEGRVMYEE